MTNEERIAKNAICDLLIKEGITGRDDEVAVDLTCSLAILAQQLGRKDCLSTVITWFDTLEKKGIRGKQAVTLDLSKANLIGEDRYGTAWKWEQPTLAKEIFHLRRAVSNPEFDDHLEVVKCKCLNNLGNRLSVAGRVIEAIDYWRRTLQVQPRFGMALCNRARYLVAYGQALEDKGMALLFYLTAHKEASAATAASAIYTDASDKQNRELAEAIVKWAESFLDVKKFNEEESLHRWDSFASDEERDYRHWCMSNCLFLNPMNDLGDYAIAADDWLPLPTHLVPVDLPLKFESFFDQMKQEYVSSRWFLYEGLTSKTPHFSDSQVALHKTDPRASLSLAVEKVKMAYRAAYSLFDKIAFFMNAYMELGIPERQITFRTLWRPRESKAIRSQFDSADNWAFCALYWLSKDFLEKENDEVAEPQARGLSEIRNHIEHKYLRVTAEQSVKVLDDDIAFMVSREQFEQKATHLLKQARAALIYMAIGVGFEEKRREPNRQGIDVEQLPHPDFLPDSDKI